MSGRLQLFPPCAIYYYVEICTLQKVGDETLSQTTRRTRYDVDMTSGSITRHLILFALPLLAGNVFQQLYNMVDTWVVGNYVSNEAFPPWAAWRPSSTCSSAFSWA